MKSDGNNNLTPAARRRQREKEQRYRTILQTAQGLFAADGYHATSMERIAEQAEVSVGTVYFYFKNKEDLLVHLLGAIGYEIRDFVGTEFRSAEASLEGFGRAGFAFFQEFCIRHPEKIVIFFRESVGQGAAVEALRKKIFDKFISDITDALARLKDTLGVEFASPMSAEVMAVAIVGMYERLAYQYLIWQDRSADLESIGRNTVDFIVGGVERLCR